MGGEEEGREEGYVGYRQEERSGDEEGPPGREHRHAQDGRLHQQAPLLRPCAKPPAEGSRRAAAARRALESRPHLSCTRVSSHGPLSSCSYLNFISTSLGALRLLIRAAALAAKLASQLAAQLWGINNHKPAVAGFEMFGSFR